MKYREGDFVKVLPFEEIAAQFVKGNAPEMPSGCLFVGRMKSFCGKVLEIDQEVEMIHGIGYYKLVGTDFYFTDEMLCFVDEPNINEERSLSYDSLFCSEEVRQ